MELIRYGLVPGASIPSLTRTQADGLLRSARRKRIGRRFMGTVTVLILLFFGGIGVIQGISWWKNRPLPPAPETTSAPDRITTTWSGGAWEPYFQPERTVLVLRKLPRDLRSLLKHQNQLFQDVIQEREAAGGGGGDSTSSRKFREMIGQFPSGEDVRVGYASNRSSGGSRTAYAYADSDSASAGITGSSNSGYSGYSHGTKGVLESHLHRYSSRIQQLSEEHAVGQIETLRKWVDQDIDELEQRRRSAGTSLSAQNEATLQWLRSDVRPYLERFAAILEEPDESESALDRWRSFESSDKESMEKQIHRLVAERIPLEGNRAVIPAGYPVLLEVVAGSRQMVLLPGEGSEVVCE